ncbi:uncharacterized protein L3040_001234 [Drepanopeziza brunnea f. sp. 'multigermtubi']|uniref:uncharacterized protein n=1 Tax=Drepanopeziza brunnea f. sp. 'multigermtubi' TaxID=698441 RepID=UPI002397665B|nr:hypothetical protein L3040_001234 [Drepanopeziza brunnea f. sp. 'multigermtubi']
MSTSALPNAYRSLLSRHRLTPSLAQAALVTRLSRLQCDLQNTPQNTSLNLRGIYIHGSVGTGKSRIADLFASTLPPSISHRRLHFHEFMMDVHSRLHVARSSPTFAGDPLIAIGRQVAEESRVLCFDEFQVTDIADALILQRLFGAVWERGGVMVATSNRVPEGLYERGLNRELFLPFIATLRERCEVWELQGKEDYRMRSRAADEGRREAVFFTDHKDFERSLDEATGGVRLEEKVIPVLMSRQLRVMAAEESAEGRGGRGGLVVRSRFEDLCENFLGSPDYYALCKASSVIYLSGLRQFRADELDFVRRFITLVDLAYEAKTRVICSSSVPLFEVFANIVPRQIRVGGDLRDELGRQMSVKGEGGSSSSMMSTFIGEMEWSATGLAEASLATGGAGESDVGFAVGRAVSRLYEMGSTEYGITD